MIVTKTFSFPCFRLNQIARSGQCFRMLPLETGGYSVISSGRYLEVREDLSTKPNKEAVVSFTCEEKDLDFWLHYFDLDTDYQIFLDFIQKNLQAAFFRSGNILSPFPFIIYKCLLPLHSSSLK